MAPRNISLSLLKGAARLVEPLASRGLTRRATSREENAEFAAQRMGDSTQARPQGALVWMHVAALDGALRLSGVIARMSADDPNLSFLVTSQNGLREEVFYQRMPQGVIHQICPLDQPNAVAQFLDHWHPAACVWCDDDLMPVLLAAVQNRGIPAALALDKIRTDASATRRWLPNLNKPMFGAFERVMAADVEVAKHAVDVGVPLGAIETCGTLNEDMVALPYNEQVRARTARQLDGRPTWLAANVTDAEIEIVLAAHKAALRVTHGLVLILHLAQSAQDHEVMEQCIRVGLRGQLAANLSEIKPQTDVILDTHSEADLGLGLWYRLAAVSFLGGSMFADGGCNPLSAAGLGSAVIHGPHVDDYADLYLRLTDAGAAVQVENAASLGEAVSELIAPHRAAEMAHAGWAACSDGAEAADALARWLWDVLERVE